MRTTTSPCSCGDSAPLAQRPTLWPHRKTAAAMMTAGSLVCLGLASVCLGAPGSDAELVVAEGWDRLVRVVDESVDGVACRAEPRADSAECCTVHFKQPLMRSDSQPGWVQVESKQGLCWLPEKSVRAVHSSPVQCLKRPVTQQLIPLELLMDETVSVASGTSVGPLFPTFYQVALEAFYPLAQGEQPVQLRDGQGRPLALVSASFKKALLMQGTAALNDGTVLNVGDEVGGERRYVALPQGHFGLGIAGFSLYPYRSVALDFDWLCDQLKGLGCTAGNVAARDKKVTKANRRALAGTLLYIPKLAGAVIGQDTHDGFVCAVDVGGGIKNDRIDIYVGTDPAGNPFYPACRRDNPFILNGVASLIPPDWHNWKKNAKGDYERAEPTEYRQNVPEKGLEVIAFPGVRCRKTPSK